MDGRQIEAAGEDFHQLFAVVGNASAGAAECEARTDDDWEANLSGEFDAVFQIVDERRFGDVEANALHRVFEKQTVFSLFDGADMSADQNYVVLFQDSAVGEFDGQVECGLSTDRGQNSKARAGRHFALDVNN